MPIIASVAPATPGLKAMYKDAAQTQRRRKTHHTDRSEGRDQHGQDRRARGGAQIAQLRHRPRRQRPLSLARVQLRDRRKCSSPLLHITLSEERHQTATRPLRA